MLVLSKDLLGFAHLLLLPLHVFGKPVTGSVSSVTPSSANPVLPHHQRPVDGPTRYQPLGFSPLRDVQRSVNDNLLEEMMEAQGLGVATDVSNSSLLVKNFQSDQVERRRGSRIFSDSERAIMAAINSPRVVPNPKASKTSTTGIASSARTSAPSSTKTTSLAPTKSSPSPTSVKTTTRTVTTTTTTTTTTTITSTSTSTTTTTPVSSPSPPVVVSPGSIPTGQSCFPSTIRSIPNVTATAVDLATNWWCADSSEYAFLGFSYSVYDCQTSATLIADFTRMRRQFGARYVRIYGYCDASWFNDALVDAAVAANVGLYGLIWFGWDGSDAWKARYGAFVKTMRTNPKAPHVFKNIALGSEPLYDWAISADNLALEIISMKDKLVAFGTDVTFSEMPYGLQINNGAPGAMAVVDLVEANVLPFFDGQATTGDNAWGVVQWSLGYFASLAPGKSIRMTQTGWPSDQSVWPGNSKTAVSSIASEKAYFDLLDSQCTYFKSRNIGWFAHIWDDNQLGGWGILNNGVLKFSFQPQVSC